MGYSGMERGLRFVLIKDKVDFLKEYLITFSSHSIVKLHTPVYTIMAAAICIELTGKYPLLNKITGILEF